MVQCVKFVIQLIFILFIINDCVLRCSLLRCVCVFSVKECNRALQCQKEGRTLAIFSSCDSLAIEKCLISLLHDAGNKNLKSTRFTYASITRHAFALKRITITLKKEYFIVYSK